MTPWTAASQASLSFTISWSLLRLISIELTMPSNHLILCHTLFFLPSIFPHIKVFSNELTLHIKWQKYWSFSCRISPSNEYSGLISFSIDLFALLAVQGDLKSVIQHQKLKASILSCSAFFVVHLAQIVKNLPEIRETWIQSLSQEFPLEKTMATHSSILAWRIPKTKEPGELHSMGFQRKGHDNAPFM